MFEYIYFQQHANVIFSYSFKCKTQFSLTVDGFSPTRVVDIFAWQLLLTTAKCGRSAVTMLVFANAISFRLCTHWHRISTVCLFVFIELFINFALLHRRFMHLPPSPLRRYRSIHLSRYLHLFQCRLIFAWRYFEWWQRQCLLNAEPLSYCPRWEWWLFLSPSISSHSCAYITLAIVVATVALVAVYWQLRFVPNLMGFINCQWQEQKWLTAFLPNFLLALERQCILSRHLLNNEAIFCSVLFFFDTLYTCIYIALRTPTISFEHYLSRFRTGILVSSLLVSIFGRT